MADSITSLKERERGLGLSTFFLLKSLHQDRQLSGHVYACWGINCILFLTRSLVFCTLICRSLYFFLSFSYCQCVFCPLNFSFWFPLWYLFPILELSLYCSICCFFSFYYLSRLCIFNIDYVLKNSKPPMFRVTFVNLTVTWLIQIILLVLC